MTMEKWSDNELQKRNRNCSLHADMYYLDIYLPIY